jgi:hypothetical protein
MNSFVTRALSFLFRFARGMMPVLLARHFEG